MPPPTSAAPRPGRMLISLAALILIMLLGIVAGSLFTPARWHKRFTVGPGPFQQNHGDPLGRAAEFDVER
jgi:hypothetical protein